MIKESKLVTNSVMIFDRSESSRWVLPALLFCITDQLNVPASDIKVVMQPYIFIYWEGNFYVGLENEKQVGDHDGIKIKFVRKDHPGYSVIKGNDYMLYYEFKYSDTESDA